MASVDDLIARHTHFLVLRQWTLGTHQYSRIIFNDELEAKPLLKTIAASCVALAGDIATFLGDDRLMHAETALGGCFLSACSYHTDALLGA
jgi:hypothetical protein